MKKVIISLIMMFGIISSTSFAGTLVINTDTSDAAPKKAFEYIIKKFEEENTDVTVKWNEQGAASVLFSDMGPLDMEKQDGVIEKKMERLREWFMVPEISLHWAEDADADAPARTSTATLSWEWWVDEDAVAMTKEDILLSLEHLVKWR